MAERRQLAVAIDRLFKETDELESLLVQLRTRLAAISVLLDTEMRAVKPPLCPKCGSPMLVRSQRDNPDSRFLGCIRYAKVGGCKGTMSLDQWREEAEAALRGA